MAWLATALPACICSWAQTPPPAAAAPGAWAAAAALCAAAPGAAGAAVVAVPAAPAAGAAPSTPDFNVLLWTHTGAALQLACRALPAQPAADLSSQIEPLLNVAEAAISASRAAPAQAILDALVRDAALAAGTIGAEQTARLQQVLAALANEHRQTRRAEGHLAAASRTLQAAGLTRTPRFAAVLVAQALAWTDLRQPGDLERAAAALDQADALLRDLGLGSSLDMIALLEARSLLAYARQDMQGTLDFAQQQLAMYRLLGHGDAPAQLHVLATVAAVLGQLNRNAEALAAYQEGLRLIDRHPGVEPAAAIGVLTNFASDLIARGELAQALALVDRSLALATQVYGTGALRTLAPLQSRGDVLMNMARYAEARAVFEQALAVAATDPASTGPVRRLRLRDSLARVQVALGETGAARELIDQGLRETAATTDLSLWRGRLLRRRAAIAANDGDWAASDADAAQAIALVGAVLGERNPFPAGFRALRCVAQTNGALPGDACAALAQLLPSVTGASPLFRFVTEAALANHAERQGRSGDALAHHLAALAAAQTAGTADPLWSAYAALAAHLRANGDRPTAVLLGKQAVEQVERMRVALGADAQRFERGFLANKLAVYRRLADWLTEDGRIDEALDVLRLLKAEELFDFVNRDGRLGGAADAGLAYSDRETALLPAWRPGDAAAAAGPSADAVQREAGRVLRWRELLAGAQPPAAAAAAAKPSPAALLAARRSQPGAGEVWAWLYAGERRVNLVIDTPARRSVVELAVSPAELARDVTQLLAAIERREPVQDRLQALHAVLAAPIERAAAATGGRRLVLAIDGPLRYLPFAALHDGRGPLGARYSIEQRVPVAAPATPVAATARSGSGTLLAMGTSRPVAGMATLDDVAHEICGIVAGPVLGLTGPSTACGPAGAGRGFVRGSGWLNGAFTAERLQTVVTQSAEHGVRRDMLHIGTHFVLRPGRMQRSWLLLGDGQQLTLEDLSRIDFSGQALVTLSACQTGVGGVDSARGNGSGEEVDGLGGLMLKRGAGAVVASLWRVEDASTSTLMQAFYRQLAAGALPAEALRRAQASVRGAGGRTAHPFYWAGFYLVGGMR